MIAGVFSVIGWIVAVLVVGGIVIGYVVRGNR